MEFFGNRTATEFFGELKLLAKKGHLGEYNCCEIYTIFIQDAGIQNPPARNLYTLCYFTKTKKTNCSPSFLNKKRLNVSTSDGDKTYGVLYQRMPLLGFLNSYRCFLRTNKWCLNGMELGHEASLSLSRAYIPIADSNKNPLLSMIKNNFFGGSYLIEHFDEKKESLKYLLDNPEQLDEISDRIQEFLPVKLATCSDRLGNIILQFPNEVMRTNFHIKGDSKSVHIEVDFASPSLIKPNLKAVSFNCSSGDDYFYGFGSNSFKDKLAILDIGTDLGSHRSYVIDEDTNLIMGSYHGNYIESFGLNMLVQSPEPRVVETEFGEKRIDLVGYSHFSYLGEAPKKSIIQWEGNRIFNDELKDLREKRTFVQYGPGVGEDRETGLKDIQYLMQRHGEKGVWLWDPYLTTDDLINTLFLSPYSNIPTRAITSFMLAKHWDQCSSESGIHKILCKAKQKVREYFKNDEERHMDRLNGWKSDQLKKLNEQSEQSKVGLRIEYRIQHGRFGWPFHDRFLLFPNKGERPLVWSLGTSINGFGRRHHVLQKVSDPARMIKVFEDLWNKLDDPSCEVFKI